MTSHHVTSVSCASSLFKRKRKEKKKKIHIKSEKIKEKKKIVNV